MDTLKCSLLFVLLLSPQVFANSDLLGELTTTDSAFGVTSSSITTVLVDWIARIVEYIFEILDLKMRTLRFLVSLWSDDNLHLFKRYVGIAQSVIQWVANVIPNSTSEASLGFLSFLFPQESHAETEEAMYEGHRMRSTEMPPLVHNEWPMGRENKEENYLKIDEVSPFADQVKSLDMLIRAQKRNLRK